MEEKRAEAVILGENSDFEGGLQVEHLDSDTWSRMLLLCLSSGGCHGTCFEPCASAVVHLEPEQCKCVDIGDRSCVRVLLLKQDKSPNIQS